MPEFAVELDSRVPGNAWTAVPSWTRIDQTNGLRAIHVRRGVPQYGSRVADPGEVTLVFDNNNGYLDRGFALSPYVSLLTPGRQLRVRWLKADGVTWGTLFQGTVDDWPMALIGDGFDATVEIVVHDSLAHHGSALTPSSLAEYELKRGVKYPRPTALYPTNESITAQDVETADVIGDFTGTPIGTPEAGSGQIVPYSNVRGIRPRRGSEIRLPAGVLDAKAQEWSVMVVFAVEEGGFVFPFRDPLLQAGCMLMVNATPTSGASARPVDLSSRDGAGGLWRVTTPGNFDDGAPHMACIGYDPAGSGRFYLYVDGVHIGNYAPTAWNYDPAQHWRAPSAGDKATSGFMGIWNGKRMVATQWVQVWADMQRPWQGHTTDQRINALLDLVAPGSARVLAVSTFPMLPVTLAEKPSLDILRRTVECADGRLWADLTNILRFSVRPVGEPLAPIRLYGTGGVPIVDATPISPPLVTECVVTNEADVSQAFNDSAAQQAHGSHRLELTDMPLASIDHLYNLAERKVYYGSRRRPHVASFKVFAAEAGWDETLELDLFNPLALAYERPWAGVVTEQGIVTAIEHDAIDAGFNDWVTTVHVEPPRSRRLFMSAPLTGQGASTPNSVANSITGDIDIRAKCVQNNWVSSPVGVIVAKGDFSTVASSYMLRALSKAKLRFNWQNAVGTSFAVDGQMPRGGSRFIWVRATLEVATGIARIWISEDGNEWIIIGSSTSGATNIRDSNAPVCIGARQDSAGAVNMPLDGNVFHAEARAGINGPLAWVFAPTEDAAGAGATSWVSSTGETWTIRTGSEIRAY